MKAIVRSSSSTIVAGSSPATILQKMQSGSAIARKPTDRSARRAARARSASACSRRADLAGVLRRGELLEQLAERAGRARCRARAASSSPRSSGARRALDAPAQGVGEHASRDAAGARRSTPARDPRAWPGGRRPTAASRRPRPARRRADRRTRVRRESGWGSWTRKPRRRWWRTSAATCARRRSLARSRPSTSRASSAPRTSWPMNVTRPSCGRTARVQRLGGVVQQRAPAQRLARGSARRRAARASSARDRCAVLAERVACRSRIRPRAHRVVSSIVRSSTSSVWPYTSRWW